MVLIVNPDVNKKHPINVSRQGIEIEFSYVFDLEDDVGGEIETLSLVVIYLTVRHMDILF